MKTKLVFLSALLLILLASCSAVFDAGVSGYVYYYNGETKTYVSDAKVSVYSDSSASNLLASTTTDSNGAYTVSRIVWESSNPKYGKTADYTTIYIKVTHDDFADSSIIPVTIVSDSTNDSQGYVELTRTRYDMPVFSGRVAEINTSASNYTQSFDSTYDEKNVWLCYKNGSDFVRYADSTAQVYTTSAQVASYDTSSTYSHGNFSALGGTRIKWEATPGDDNYANMTVYIVFDAQDSGADGFGEISTGDKYAAVVIQSGTDAYTVVYSSFTGTI
ncbi:MAG: hypothetical protein K5634_07765 [Sphaerochaetaceae bacterium]|nr:hypothetical protein [Sphaerochaetaceae bacterium]